MNGMNALIDALLWCGGVAVGLAVSRLRAPRHQHNWAVQSVHYTPPFKMSVQTGPAEELIPMFRRASEGITHIYLRCGTCGDIKEQDVYGHFAATSAPGDAELKRLREIAGID
jgi:hypothetical protein